MIIPLFNRLQNESRLRKAGVQTKALPETNWESNPDAPPSGCASGNVHNSRGKAFF